MANPSIHVAYHQGLESLEKLLAKVQRSGDFFVHGAVEVPMPKVEVDGVGMLSFPVPQMQILELIKHAERAPYGLGEQTVLDPSVRRVWQLPPKKAQLGGKSWVASLRNIVDQAAVGLGCEAAAVSAEFYKMLVYDPGAFFASHRDTEKSEGMFGTLVVVLPSVHRGGELVIRHAGREVVVDVSAAEMSKLAFIAFYADCQHEVRPIIEGNRVCLVYNLVQVRGSKAGRSSLSAPLYDSEVAAVAKRITEAMGAPHAPAKIVWLLEHHYSPDGLSFSGLKNADAARAKVLLQAAVQARCVMHLGIVHIEESGAAESSYDGYGSRGRSRSWSYDEDDEDEQDVSNDDFEIVDVCDSSRYVDHWVDARDRRVEFGQIPLGEGELLPQGALNDEAPDKQRLTEATGNEGASFERSYHRAVLVLWPQERFAEVLFQAGVGAVMPYLQDQIEACGASSVPPAAHAQAAALAARVLNAWENLPEHQTYGQSNAVPCRVKMLVALGQLGDATLLQRFVGGVVTREYDGTENVALTAHARLLTPESAGKLLAKLSTAHMRWTPGACVDLLRRLLRDHRNKPSEDWVAAFKHMATAIVDGLVNVEGDGERKFDHPHWHQVGQAKPINAALVADLLNALRTLEIGALRETAVTNIVARPIVFDPGTVVVPALALLHPRHAQDPANDKAFLRLWTHAGEFLLDRSEHPPEAPRDWRQAVKLACKCEDCRALETFARDAEAQVGRFRVRQDRRQHLQDVINRHGFDMTYVTEQKGSPQTLICTKTRRTYHRQCEQYRADISSFGELTETARSPDACTALASRMVEARRRAENWSAGKI